MADEVAVAATETPADPPTDQPRPLYVVTTGIETDSLRLEAGEKFDGTGFTFEQMGHLIALGAIHLESVAPVPTPQPELIDAELVQKMATLAAASANPAPLADVTVTQPDAAVDADAMRTAALNALLSKIAPDASPEELKAVDDLASTETTVA